MPGSTPQEQFFVSIPRPQELAADGKENLTCSSSKLHLLQVKAMGKLQA